MNNKSIVIRGVPGGTITSIGLQRTPVEWTQEDKDLFLSVKVARDGSVHRGGRRIGYVDHYNPARPSKKSHLWRAVREGGHFRFGFDTRAQAVEWLSA